MNAVTIIRLFIASAGIAASVTSAAQCTKEQLAQISISKDPEVTKACGKLTKALEGSGSMSDEDVKSFCSNKSCTAAATAAVKKAVPNCEVEGLSLSDLMHGIEWACDENLKGNASAVTDAGAHSGSGATGNNHPRVTTSQTDSPKTKLPSTSNSGSRGGGAAMDKPTSKPSTTPTPTPKKSSAERLSTSATVVVTSLLVSTAWAADVL